MFLNNLINSYAELSGLVRGIIGVTFGLIVYLLLKLLINSANKGFAQAQKKPERGNYRERLAKRLNS
jgi:hypothetical protein